MPGRAPSCHASPPCHGFLRTLSGRTCFRRPSLEPLRNRVMLALAYDAGLRREELCLLATGDIDPAHRLLTVRAETTKSRRGRVVPYSEAAGSLLSAYLAHRRTLTRTRGPLFVSESRRNAGVPAELLDLVQGGAFACGACRLASTEHPHLPSPLLNGPRPRRVGTARDRQFRRPPQHQHHLDLHPPQRTGADRKDRQGGTSRCTDG